MRTDPTHVHSPLPPARALHRACGSAPVESSRAHAFRQLRRGRHAPRPGPGCRTCAVGPTVANERTLHAAQVRSLLRAVGAHLVSLRLTEEADGAEYASRLWPMGCLLTRGAHPPGLATVRCAYTMHWLGLLLPYAVPLTRCVPTRRRHAGSPHPMPAAGSGPMHCIATAQPVAAFNPCPALSPSRSLFSSRQP